MLGTIRFDDGNRVETVGVVEVEGRFVAGTGDENTVRVRIKPAYKGRDVITIPEGRVSWIADPETAMAR